jgi:hypothetical protein
MPIIDRDGVRIHDEIHGSEPLFILTHGFPSTSQMCTGRSRRKAVIPLAGHAVNIDQPQAFIDAAAETPVQ